MMDCTRAAELLDDFVDGELPEAAAREMRGHLASCSACAGAEAELRALLHRAARLPAEMAPARDLWPGIRDRVDTTPHLTPRMRRPMVAHVWMAAAAVLLVVLTSVVTFWVARRGSPAAARPAAPSTELVALRASEPDYLQARKALVAALNERRRHLSPETVKVIDQNLAVMDQALRSMKTALDKDPGNRGLVVLIESTYRQEIQLLMQAASLPTNA